MSNSSLKRFVTFSFIVFLLSQLGFPSVPCFGNQSQEKPLKRLLNEALGGLLGEGKIDSLQVVEETDFRVVVEVAYSGIKNLAGQQLVVEPFGYNHAALPGFECETKILGQKQGTLRLAVLFRGSGSPSIVQSTTLEARLFLPPKNTKTSRILNHMKSWTAAPNGYSLSESGGYATSSTGSGEGVVIEPVPMFKPEDLKSGGENKPVEVMRVARKANISLGPTARVIAPAASGISTTDFYRIEAKCSGKCLDVSGISVENGANVYQWEWVGGDNQKWKFVPQADGFYEIVAKHSGKCLDVANWGKEKEVNVWQWDVHGGDNQLWKLVPLGDGYYKIVSKWSGKCLDVQWASKENAANVWQYDDINSDAQKWKLIVVK